MFDSWKGPYVCRVIRCHLNRPVLHASNEARGVGDTADLSHSTRRASQDDFSVRDFSGGRCAARGENLVLLDLTAAEAEEDLSGHRVNGNARDSLW